MRKIGILLVFLVVACGWGTVSAQEAKSGGFNLVVVGDPQAQTREQLARLEHDIIPQIGEIVEEYKATGYPTAILLTGDVVWDNMKFLPRVKAAFESLGVPLYAVIGNHDHNKHHTRNQRRAERNYEEVFGPRNQSFMLGNTLFVTFDNIDYTSFSGYGEDVDSKQLRWLAEMMESVADDQRVAVCMHATAVNFNNNTLKPYIKPLVAILGEREIHFVTGHRHHHGTADLGNGIYEHNVAGVNGNLWFAPLSSDGMPYGVFCIEERGDEWLWHHRTLGKNFEEQLVVWREGFVKDSEEYIVVKVIGWDDKWCVEWFENGVSMGAMEQIEILDPDYMHYVENEADYAKKYMDRLRRSAHPHSHYYRCRREHKDSEIMIKATDRFGREFIEVVK